MYLNNKFFKNLLTMDLEGQAEAELLAKDNDFVISIIPSDYDA